ncbi:CD44 antigen [Triplophysa tibetana]|uniref:CD44 antigen n=1 Tax=Triplophysa tibetana TaxID=1572043 RepID=A0A5A9PP35_9TELE|nr:CD44 antigen [Triplophysa tibetana]
MWTLIIVMVATGLPAIYRTAPVQGHSGRCSFAGVLHVEETSNYSLTFQNALELCQSLGYRLATQEQVIEAYKYGLRTCRYGWIDGQLVAFLPHSSSPNCDSSSTEMTFHSEAAEYLSDVYCLNPSDPFDVNCEDAVKSASQTSSRESRTVGKLNEDILEEALVEGFLVDLERIDLTDTQDAEGPTNKLRFVRSAVNPTVLFPEEEGSGSGLNPEIPDFTQLTTRSSTVEPTEKETLENVRKEVIKQGKGSRQGNTQTDQMGQKNGDNMLNSDSTSTQQSKGSPSWLVILATSVVFGAILCIFAAIATKDKWYGPRKGKNKMSEDYSKAGTLPLSEKEQEIVKLSVANVQNGKTEDFNVNSRDEHEREYLM